MRIYTTGRLAIESNGTLLGQEAFPGRQGLLAFARLLASRHSAVRREDVAAVLWPDELPRAWDAALNAIASKLRLLLAQAGLNKNEVLVAAMGCYQLNLPHDTWVDVDAATDALHEAEGLLRGARHREAWAAAQVAYHITRRPYLPGESGQWVAQMREQIAMTFIRACECLAETYIWNGEPEIAVDVSKQAIALQPFRETGYQLLMRAHAAAGNRAEALWAYENCRKLIADELGVAPSAETQSVYLGILHAR